MTFLWPNGRIIVITVEGESRNGNGSDQMEG